MTLKIGALTKIGLFFPVVCFRHVFDQTLAEQLYHDKRDKVPYLKLAPHPPTRRKEFKISVIQYKIEKKSPPAVVLE